MRPAGIVHGGCELGRRPNKPQQGNKLVTPSLQPYHLISWAASPVQNTSTACVPYTHLRRNAYQQTCDMSAGGETRQTTFSVFLV